jgi:hypothetical protein
LDTCLPVGRSPPQADNIALHSPSGRKKKIGNEFSIHILQSKIELSNFRPHSLFRFQKRLENSGFPKGGGAKRRRQNSRKS